MVIFLTKKLATLTQCVLRLFPLHRSGCPSGPCCSCSLPAWWPARLQRCLGGVLPPAGGLLWHGQPPVHGCSASSPSGTPPIRTCPQHALKCGSFALPLTSLDPSGLTGFQRRCQQPHFNQTRFSPTQALNF